MTPFLDVIAKAPSPRVIQTHLRLGRMPQDMLKKSRVKNKKLHESEASILGAGGAVAPHVNMGGKHIVLPPPPNNFDNLKNS